MSQWFNAKTFDLDLSAYATLERIVGVCMTLPAFIDAQPNRRPDAG